jgi:UDP-N-acetylglucosamine 3-dehydrogenase
MNPSIGIVGAGLMGNWHARRWQHLPVPIAGYFDVDRHKAEQACQRYGGRVFSDLEELAQASDIVQICSPPRYHKPAVEAALRWRRPIFCEKPLAREYAEASEIVRLCEEAGVRLYVGQVLRFFHQYAHARRLVRSGMLGTPRLIHLTRAAGHPAQLDDRGWFRSVANTGGAVMEGGVHDLDFARWCMGEVERVYAQGITYRDDLELVGDHSLVILHFESGALGYYEASWMLPDGKFRQQFEISGTAGRLEYDSFPSEQLVFTPRDEPAGSELPQEHMNYQDDPYLLQLKHFLGCLQNDQQFLVTPRDALAALRLSLAAHESMLTQRVVDVKEIL